MESQASERDHRRGLGDAGMLKVHALASGPGHASRARPEYVGHDTYSHRYTETRRHGLLADKVAWESHTSDRGHGHRDAYMSKVLALASGPPSRMRATTNVPEARDSHDHAYRYMRIQGIAPEHPPLRRVLAASMHVVPAQAPSV